jgi:hypothetical protein
MSKADEILKSWETRRPVEVRIGDVEIVLEKYFPGEWVWQKSSHIVVTSKILAIHPQFRMGIMSVPTVSGRTVKSFYINNIIKAIEFIKQYEDWKNGKRS